MNFSGSRLIDKWFLAYIRKVPNHPFKVRIVNYINDIFFNNSVKIKFENDVTFPFSSREQMGRGIMVTGEYEPLTIKMCKETLSSGGVLVDIGANIGLFSIYLSRIKGVTVYSIEPSVQNFHKFLFNLEQNKAENIIPINVGLSYEDSFGYMVNQSPINSGTFKVVEDKSETDTYLIRLCTLAELVKYLNITAIKLIKIDVEGYEMNIFKGFFTKNNSIMPENIVMEFGDQIERTGHNLLDSFNFFIDMGYQPFDVAGKPYTFGDDLPEGNLWLKYHSN
jgi:FkbM family methyltransferase